MSEGFNINFQETADYIAHENTNAMIKHSFNEYLERINLDISGEAKPDDEPAPKEWENVS